mmetsp:Transcript_2998/g.4545  ORF Transcript_2998/g.4545 Transcript_2998/m.4545 type:complete len:229 (-) Transcript_2998:765-1451(-)
MNSRTPKFLGMSMDLLPNFIASTNSPLANFPSPLASKSPKRAFTTDSPGLLPTTAFAALPNSSWLTPSLLPTTLMATSKASKFSSNSWNSRNSSNETEKWEGLRLPSFCALSLSFLYSVRSAVMKETRKFMNSGPSSELVLESSHMLNWTSWTSLRSSWTKDTKSSKSISSLPRKSALYAAAAASEFETCFVFETPSTFPASVWDLKILTNEDNSRGSIFPLWFLSNM